MDAINTTNLTAGERALRMAATAGLIAVVTSHSGELGYLTLLPLLAIYTGLTALTGMDPVDAAIKGTKESVDAAHQIGGAAVQ